MNQENLFKENLLSSQVDTHVSRSQSQVGGEVNAREVEGTGVQGDMEWEFGDRGTLRETDQEKSTADRPVFHVELPARGDDQKAVKVEHTLNVIIKNEW